MKNRKISLSAVSGRIICASFYAKKKKKIDRYSYYFVQLFNIDQYITVFLNQFDTFLQTQVTVLKTVNTVS